MEEYQITLKIAAYLLGYPDESWQKDFSEYRAAVEEIKTLQIKNTFLDLFDYVEKIGAQDYEKQYVRTFDFSQNTNLYLTTHDRTDFGKQANEMHDFNILFMDSEYQLDKELPDYLPAILELASESSPQDAKKILDSAKNKIQLLRERFIEARLAQAFLIDAILTVTDSLEVKYNE